MKLKSSLILLSGFVLLYVCCKDNPSSQIKNNNLNSGTDSLTSRKAKILECAGCHKDVYENWIIDPHAHSFNKLIEHLEKIKNPEWFPVEYAKDVQANIEKCMNCHASQNLYETNFLGLDLETDESKFNQSSYPQLFALAVARPETDDRSTGIDCLTCHNSKNGVVTNAAFNQSASSPYCNPVASKFFSTNLNCGSCHIYESLTIQKYHENSIVSDDLNCVKCHQEYDAAGKGTHYFFWRHDDVSEKKRPKPVSGIFDGIKIEISKDEEKPYLNFEWKNTVSPHSFSECGEIVLDIEVIDKEGISVFKATERLNRKKFHDSDLQRLFPHGKIPGAEGYLFESKEAPLRQKYDLSSKLTEGMIIRLTGKQKAQYWASDSIAKTVYSRDIALQP